MSTFVIVETDSGLTVATVDSGETIEDAAVREGGILFDTETYSTYEDACEALEAIPEDEIAE